MNQGDFKLFFLNITAMGVSMSTIETTLKILLLAASIGYTVHRWYLLRKEK